MARDSKDAFSLGVSEGLPLDDHIHAFLLLASSDHNSNLDII